MSLWYLALQQCYGQSLTVLDEFATRALEGHILFELLVAAIAAGFVVIL